MRLGRIIAIICIVVFMGLVARVAHADGTGYVASANGLVITNYHVVQDLGNQPFVLVNGLVHKAVILYASIIDDIAVVKLLDVNEQPCLKTVSAQMNIGETYQILKFDMNKLMNMMSHLSPNKLLGIIRTDWIHLVGVASVDFGSAQRHLGLFYTGVVSPISQPGNSGSPIVNAAKEVVALNEGAVVGVNQGIAITNNPLVKFTTNVGAVCENPTNKPHQALAWITSL